MKKVHLSMAQQKLLIRLKQEMKKLREQLKGQKDKEEKAQLKKELDEMKASEVAERIKKRVGNNNAYLTFDIDFLDPAYAPGTGTPVSGGPSVIKGRNILKALAGLNIVGGDLVEIAPAYDPIGNITAVAGATLGGDILYLISEALRR